LSTSVTQSRMHGPAPARSAFVQATKGFASPSEQEVRTRSTSTSEVNDRRVSVFAGLRTVGQTIAWLPKEHGGRSRGHVHARSHGRGDVRHADEGRRLSRRGQRSRGSGHDPGQPPSTAEQVPSAPRERARSCVAWACCSFLSARWARWFWSGKAGKTGSTVIEKDHQAGPGRTPTSRGAIRSAGHKDGCRRRGSG